jgi:hypothetical protein
MTSGETAPELEPKGAAAKELEFGLNLRRKAVNERH